MSNVNNIRVILGMRSKYNKDYLDRRNYGCHEDSHFLEVNELFKWVREFEF